MEDLKIKSEQLYVKNRMYISENDTLQLNLQQLSRKWLEDMNIEVVTGIGLIQFLGEPIPS